MNIYVNYPRLLEVLARCVSDGQPPGAVEAIPGVLRDELGLDLTVRDVSNLMLLGVASGAMKGEMRVADEVSCCELFDHLTTLPSPLDGPAFLAVVREQVPHTVGDEVIESMRRLAMEFYECVETNAEGYVIRCGRCEDRLLSRDESRRRATPGNQGTPRTSLPLNPHDRAGTEMSADEVRVIALLRWWGNEHAALQGGAATAPSDEPVSDTAPLECEACSRPCGECGANVGATELIQLFAASRSYHCRACGWQRATFPLISKVQAASLGECPGCGEPDRVDGDRLTECVNGHEESENKFLLAAVFGISGFSCATCHTRRFRIRGGDEH